MLAKISLGDHPPELHEGGFTANIFLTQQLADDLGFLMFASYTKNVRLAEDKEDGRSKRGSEGDGFALMSAGRYQL